MRDSLRARHLNARSAPAWEETDLACDSRLFWRVRIASYVNWEMLYLRLGYEPRVKRLLVAVLAIVLASYFWPNLVHVPPLLSTGEGLWSPSFVALAASVLVGVIVVERGLFGLRMHRGLTRTENRGITGRSLARGKRSRR
ncbi:MAG: hypothetical protein M3151_13780 [Actinomycetota bacterium]|nr:hypothetical protein [Actinomycetota bacterium]